MKDETAEYPIPRGWRPQIGQLVAALVDGDFGLSRGVPSVAAPESKLVDQMREYVAEYGETLAALDDATWKSSVARWMGTHWEMVIDLWTVESGRSDLVLALRVFETDGGFRFEIDGVYVP